MKWSDRNMDRVMFDYLEGELSGEERHQLEVEALHNDVLREELELWQSSYVDSEFYDTSLLEGSLVSIPKITPFSSFTFYLNSILIIAISFISSTKVQLEPEMLTVRNTFTATRIEAKIPELKPGEFVPVSPTTLNGIPETYSSNDPAFDLSFDREEIDFEIMEMHPMVWSDLQMNPEGKVEIKALKVPVKLREKDRKKLRQIERMKGRAERERRAAEFMRGNIPYVVPIDTQNF